VLAAVGIWLVGGLLFSLWRFVPPSVPEAAVHENVTVSREVGEVVGHSDRAIVLAQHYGYPLAFYGSVRGEPWPTGADQVFLDARGDDPLTVEEQYDQLAETTDADYFIVVDLAEWSRQPDLQAFLRGHFDVVAETADYVVFDLRSGEASAG
jgi:hypothetical protein